ncbi:hypothetical protein HY625_01620 [Candidatus Uhrbacteria bacterium]|nr:hypothetical protein [Candidatus Uhrbacteria bacterium]
MGRRSLKEIFRVVPWAQVGYPAGVLLVFAVILSSAFFSYYFFSAMMQRVTVVPLSSGDVGLTFHLQEYRQVAPSFGLAESKTTDTPSFDRTKLMLAIKNAQLRNDRVILLQELLKNDGWPTKAIEENEVRSESVTTVAAKESYGKEGEALIALLVKNGFVVSRGKPLLKEEKFDILITLGTY